MRHRRPNSEDNRCGAALAPTPTLTPPSGCLLRAARLSFEQKRVSARGDRNITDDDHSRTPTHRGVVSHTKETREQQQQEQNQLFTKQKRANAPCAPESRWMATSITAPDWRPTANSAPTLSLSLSFEQTLRSKRDPGAHPLGQVFSSKSPSLPTSERVGRPTFEARRARRPRATPSPEKEAHLGHQEQLLKARVFFVKTK